MTFDCISLCLFQPAEVQMDSEKIKEYEREIADAQNAALPDDDEDL